MKRIRYALGAALWTCATLSSRPGQAEPFDVPPAAPIRSVASVQPPAATEAATQPPPANNAPTANPLPEAPETTVVGQPGGIGSQGGATPGSTTIDTATRVSTPLSQIGSSVSVITAEQIQQRQITSVTEALRALPGVDVVQSGGPGNVTSVFIRGATSEQTKVMLDGIPMNDPMTTGRLFDFSTLGLDNIERIEVIRGPQSTLYGSDAIGGVINIITTKGSGPLQAKYRTLGGSFGTSQQAISASGGNSQFYSSWAGSYFDTRGFSAADRRLPGNTEKDPFHRGNLGGRMGWTPFDNADVDFVFRYNRADVKIDDAGGAFMDDPNQKNVTEQIATRTQLRLATVDDLWEQKLAYSTVHQTRRNIDPTDPLHPLDSFFSTFNGFTQLIDWQNNLRLLENNTLIVGAIYQQEDGDSRFTGTSGFGPFSGGQPASQLRDAAVYAQDQITLGDRWFTTLGIRQDHYSQAGMATTHRFTSLYRLPGSETGVRGSIGSGFKAPTLFQLFDPFSGNTALLPEQSQGWDVGVEQPLWDGDLVLAATYFHNDFTNLIDFDNVTFRYFNVGQAMSQGTELSSFARLTDTATVTLNYTFMTTHNLITGTPLLRRPRDKVSMIFNNKLTARTNLNTMFTYVGNRFDQDFNQFPATNVVLHNYILVNAALTYDWTRQCQLFVRGDNLTNEVYQEVFGFGTAGVSGYGGATFTW